MKFDTRFDCATTQDEIKVSLLKKAPKFVLSVPKADLRSVLKCHEADITWFNPCSVKRPLEKPKCEKDLQCFPMYQTEEEMESTENNNRKN